MHQTINEETQKIKEKYLIFRVFRICFTIEWHYLQEHLYSCRVVFQPSSWTETCHHGYS